MNNEDIENKKLHLPKAIINGKEKNCKKQLEAKLNSKHESTQLDLKLGSMPNSTYYIKS